MPAASTQTRPGGRRFTPVDRLIAPLDVAVRTLFGTSEAARAYPASDIEETVHDAADRERVAALMRINHSGEVAAQALYQGQALVARSQETRDALVHAGREESDHLAWCSERISELGGRTSLLNPVWYAGSFAIGALAGLAGDKTSLGFVAETERQVGEHLEGHLQQLPQGDARTHAILEQMRVDEEHHGSVARAAGAESVPRITRTMMRIAARVMTRTAHWL